MKLFEPGKIGSLALKNRIVMSAMTVEALVWPEGMLGQRGIDQYVARAKGGTGLIIPNAAHPQQIEQLPSTPRVDRKVTVSTVYMSWLNELADAIHDYGAKVAFQLSPGAGHNSPRQFLAKIGAVAPSPLPCFYDHNFLAHELTTERVERLARVFQHAAELLRAAGIDAIELNWHGGYLGDEFLTGLWNKRTDKYGGDLEGRLRFLLEVVESIRRGAGVDFPIIVKYGLTHYLEGGREINEGLEIARRLESAGVNALHIDGGCYETMYRLFPTTYSPPGSLVKLAEMVKKVVNIPVIAVGNLGHPKLAERVLQEGKADFIALGRPLLADPEWANKVKEGRLEDICPCLGDNVGCIGNVFKGNDIRCVVNPATGMEREYTIRQTDKKKSVLVVGGGPGGMEAARIAALRGHKVTLWEKGAALGGNLILISMPDFKQDYRNLINYLSTQIEKLGVTIKLRREATAELIQELKPDAVVLATGGEFVTSQIPGIDEDNVVSVWDLREMLMGCLKWSTIKEKRGWQKILWFTGNTFARFLKPSVTRWLARLWVPFGKRVIIIGSSHGECELALYLAERGKKVTIVEASHCIAVDDTAEPNHMHLLKLLADANVKVLTGTNVPKITDEGITIADKDGKTSTLEADTVVVAVSLKPGGRLLEALKDKVPEVYAIGDCVEPRKTMINAISEGSRIGRLI